MTAQEYNDMFAEPYHHKLRIRVLDTSPEVVFTNESILSESMTIEDSLFSDTSMRLGACESKRFSIQVISPDSLVGKWIEVSMFTDMPDVLVDDQGNKIVDSDGDNIVASDNSSPAEYISLGKFKVFSDKLSNDRVWRTLVCYDAMYDILHADVLEWYEDMSYSFPMSMSNFRNRFFYHLGITQESATLINDSLMIQGGFNAEGELSGKTIIEAICELNGCFGHITREGKFKYVTFDTYTNVTLDHYIDGSGTYEDYVVDNVDGVVARSAAADVGTPSSTATMNNPYYLEDNPLVYGLEGSDSLIAALGRINTALQRIMIYRPYTVQTYGNPFLDVGTRITIVTRDQTIDSFVFQKSMSGIQALRDTLTAEGEKTLPTKSNSMASDLKRTKGKVHVLENTIDEFRSEIYSYANTNVEYIVTPTSYTYGNGILWINIDLYGEIANIFTPTNGAKLGIRLDGSVTDAQLQSGCTVYINGIIHWDYGTSTFTRLVTEDGTTAYQCHTNKGYIMNLEYFEGSSGSSDTFRILRDSYSHSEITQTAEEIRLGVEKLANATLPVLDVDSSVVDNNKLIWVINDPPFSYTKASRYGFKFGIKVPTIASANVNKFKYVRLAFSDGNTLEEHIVLSGNQYVTNQLSENDVVYLRYDEVASESSGSLISVVGFHRFTDEYAQSQIDITSNQIVLKVDSNGNIVQVALGANASTGSTFDINADNISFVANSTLNMTASNLNITSDKFSVDSEGNVTATNLIVEAPLLGGGDYGLTINNASHTTLGEWGTNSSLETLSFQNASRRASYSIEKTNFEAYFIGTADTSYSFGSSFEGSMKFVDGIFSVEACTDWVTGNTGTISIKPLTLATGIEDAIGFNSRMDINNSDGWGISGVGGSNPESLLIALTNLYTKKMIMTKTFEDEVGIISSQGRTPIYLDDAYTVQGYTPIAIADYDFKVEGSYVNLFPESIDFNDTSGASLSVRIIVKNLDSASYSTATYRIKLIYVADGNLISDDV